MYNVKKQFLQVNFISAASIHGNQFNNHFNNANYVTKVDHLCSERHTFNFLLKKVDFRSVNSPALDNLFQMI